jgi:anthranilate phosphoribosyltransferase
VLSPALDQWVERRRTIIKRPFLSTIEKVLNPARAKLLVCSVFHITYQQKMVDLALRAGFKGVMVLKRGLEASLAPSTAKASGILCGALDPAGQLRTTTLEASAAAFAAYRRPADDVLENASPEANAALVAQYAAQGQTGQPDFDNRVAFAQALYGQGLRWVEQTWAGEGL